MDALTLVLAATAVAGLYMAWNIGANDVANAMGTSVGSGALSLRSALIIAAVFELAGALLAGGPVSNTIASGIVEMEGLSIPPIVLASGMASSLVAAALWVHGATALGYPVSTTHSIVGAVLGFGLCVGGADHTNWDVLGGIVVSWVLSPILGGLVAFFLYRVVQRTVFESADPSATASRFAPFAVCMLAAFCTALLLSGDGIRWPFSGHAPTGRTALLLGIGFVVALTLLFTVWLRLQPRRTGATAQHAESLFGAMQVVSACFIAFAHGSNDVANAAGPVAAAFRALSGGPGMGIPPNVLMIGACGIVLGLSTYGFRVMATIGREITQLTPSKGFAAETAAALTLVACSRLALPVSTTSVIVGAVVGVGLHRTLDAINMRVLRRIAASWVVAVPVSAALSFLFTQLVRWSVQ